MDIQKRLDRTDYFSSNMIIDELNSHLSIMTDASMKKFSLACRAIVHNHKMACERAALDHINRNR